MQVQFVRRPETRWTAIANILTVSDSVVSLQLPSCVKSTPNPALLADVVIVPDMAI